MGHKGARLIDRLRIAASHRNSLRKETLYRGERRGFAEGTELSNPLRTPKPSAASAVKCCFLSQLGDDPERLLPAGDALAIVEGVAPALPVIVPGRAGGVRAEDRVLQREQLV